jgi:16S rRNA (cytosine967-C5)-methyltransferase
MNLLTTTYDLLKNLKEGKYTFSALMNKKIGECNLDELDKNYVKNSLKCVVNRYHTLRFQILEEFKTNDDVLLDYLIIGLSYLLFVKGFSKQDLLTQLQEVSAKNHYDLDMSIIESVYDHILEKPYDKLVGIYEDNFIKKTALLYSYPEWIVGMVKKQYGSKNAYKSFAATRKTKKDITVCLNPMEDSNEISKDPSFKKEEYASTAYSYEGVDSLVKVDLFRKKKIYVMDGSEQILADFFNPLQSENILIFGEQKSLLALTCAYKMNDFGVVNYFAPDSASYFDAKTKVKSFGVKSLNVEEADYNLLCTHLEYESCDRVLCMPKNTRLGEVRKYPEILLQLKQSDLDGIIAYQKEAINETSKYVKKGGMLFYSVPTLNAKESMHLVHNFLEDHKDFALVEEQMVFPYEHKTSGIYFAKLKKNEMEEQHD